MKLADCDIWLIGEKSSRIHETGCIKLEDDVYCTDITTMKKKPNEIWIEKPRRINRKSCVINLLVKHNITGAMIYKQWCMKPDNKFRYAGQHKCQGTGM